MLLRILLLHCYYIIITYYHYYMLLRHYYVIITSLLPHYSKWLKQVIMSPLLLIMHFPRFHYYIVITHYYHYYPLLHVTDRATCRCRRLRRPALASGVGSLAEFRAYQATQATCPCFGRGVSGGVSGLLGDSGDLPSCVWRGVSGGVSGLLGDSSDLPSCFGRGVSGGV